MIGQNFEKFFSIGSIKVGPTIISPFSPDGNMLGSIELLSTEKDIFLPNKKSGIIIREFNNSISEDLYNALQYLSIDKVKFDYYMNELFIMEWESYEEKNKPDISVLKKRAYIFFS
jgi:hypothetical protein